MCVLFTALLWHHIEENPIASLCPPSLLLSFIPPSLSSLHSPILSTYCWVFSMCSHSALPIPPLSSSMRPSLHHYLCFCCAILLGSQRYHHFPALFFSLSPSLPLFMTPSNPLSLSNDCVVLLWSGPNFRTGVPPDCAPLSLHLSSLFSTFCPSHSLVLATEMCHCEKRPSLSSSIKCMALSCSFFHSVLSCFCHSCFLSFPPFLSIPKDFTCPPCPLLSSLSHVIRSSC